MLFLYIHPDQGRRTVAFFKKEESLSTIGKECRLTTGRGDSMESATENIPPYW